MGFNQSKSETTVDVVTRVVAEVTKNVSHSCGALGSSNMTIIQDAGQDAVMDNVNQSSEAYIDLSCEITSEMETQFENEVQHTLENELKNKLSGMGFGNSTESEANIKSLTEAVSRVSINDIKSCLAESSSTMHITQKAGRDAVMRNVSQSAITKVIGDCVMRSSEITKAINKFETNAKVKSVTENLGLNLFGDSAIAGAICSFILFISLICCLLILFF